jgi:hypothetical protein
MASNRVRIAAVAAGVALAGASAVLLSPGAQAFEQRIDQPLDLGGLACVHVGAHIAIPEQVGDPTALALQRLDVAPGPCTT